MKTMRDALETFIDQTSLADVLSALEQVTQEKADHIREAWQDEGLAREWDRAAAKITSVLATLPRVPGISRGLR